MRGLVATFHHVYFGLHVCDPLLQASQSLAISADSICDALENILGNGIQMADCVGIMVQGFLFAQILREDQDVVLLRQHVFNNTKSCEAALPFIKRKRLKTILIIKS